MHRARHAYRSGDSAAGDEATSSIDTRTELQVQAAFELHGWPYELGKWARLKAVRNADCILVMRYW